MSTGVCVIVNTLNPASNRWLLPWWWKHYSRHNSYPVAWMDIGMDDWARAWCKDHGQIVTVDLPPQCKGTISGQPIALLQSPFDVTAAIHLDCEVRANIGPLFEIGRKNFAAPPDLPCKHFSVFSVSLAAITQPANSGVLAMHRGCKILKRWAELCGRYPTLEAGDMDTLNLALGEFYNDWAWLPEEWCYMRRSPVEGRKTARIMHWTCPQGKEYIRTGREFLPNEACIRGREKFFPGIRITA